MKRLLIAVSMLCSLLLAAAYPFLPSRKNIAGFAAWIR